MGSKKVHIRAEADERGFERRDPLLEWGNGR